MNLKNIIKVILITIFISTQTYSMQPEQPRYASLEALEEIHNMAIEDIRAINLARAQGTIIKLNNNIETKRKVKQLLFFAGVAVACGVGYKLGKYLYNKYKASKNNKVTTTNI